METIIANLLNSLGAPGIIIAIIYFLGRIEIVSIINSSDLEWLYLSQEKRLLYKSFYLIGLIILTFIFLLFILVFLVDSKINTSIIIITNIVFCIMFIASLFASLKKDISLVISIRKCLGEHKIIKNIFITFFYFFLIFLFIISIVFHTNNGDKVNLSITIIANLIITSIVIPIIVILFMKVWIIVDIKHFYFMDGNYIWYLIKPHYKSMLVGDKPIEEECMKYKYIDLTELRSKIILVQKPSSEG